MKRIKWIIIGCLAILSSSQAASFDCYQKKFQNCGVEIPLDIKQSLKNAYPNSEILSEDLDHDGIYDFVIFTSEQTSDALVDKVVILKGKPDGTYAHFAKSSNIEHSTATLGIKNQSIYITVIHNSIKESLTEIYQFKYRANGIFLIGEEEISYGSVDDDEKHWTESRISTNFLTGEVIQTEMKDGKATRTTKETVERKLLSLEDFSR